MIKLGYSWLFFLATSLLISCGINADHRSIDSNPGNDRWKWFSTKTVYQDAFDALNCSLSMNLISNRSQMPLNCRANSVVLISRHATRLPDRKMIVEMQIHLDRLRSSLLSNLSNLESIGFDLDTLNELQNWKLQMNAKHGKRIVDYGRNEARALGSRFAEKYADLLEPQSGANVSVGVTFKIRTKETAEEFFAPIKIKYPSLDFNPIVKGSLLSHRQCKKHLKDQGVKLTRSKTYTDFVNSPEYQRLLHDFARLTGKNSMADSTESKQSQLSIDFKLIYSTCIYEQAIHGRSVWCRLFSQRQLQLLEYGNDLNVYFSGAYGWDINRRLTCDLLQEIVHVFRQAILNRQRRTIRLNFTHAGLMKRLFAMFGISPRFASTHCQTSNSCSNEWRTSLLLPFLANFELTLYECPDARPEWFVMAKIQEHPIRLHGCDQLYCPIDQFFDSYEHLVRDCDLKKICRL